MIIRKTIAGPYYKWLATRFSSERIAKRMGAFSSVFLRLALGVSFLSAVGDRFGFWGGLGRPNVAWGDFSHFFAYTAKLNWFMPSATIPAVAWASTCAEILLGVALVLGAFIQVAAFFERLTPALIRSCHELRTWSCSAAQFFRFLCLCWSVLAGDVPRIFLER